MKRILIAGLLLALPAWPRSMPGGRHLRQPLPEIFRHELLRQTRPASTALRDGAAPVQAVLPDAGQIAVLDDGDGVFSAAGFDLDGKTVLFQPAGTNASQYTYSVAGSRFDAQAPGAGTTVRLGDDDAAAVSLPFAFPFYGQRHNTLFLHSDGNFTFNTADASSFERDFVRLVTGPPRAAPLFIDLDPSQPEGSVTYVSSPGRFLITWNNLPLYSDTPGPQVPRQTFQAALFEDGRIEFSYRGVNSVSFVVVGIAPGDATRLEQVAFVDLTAANSTAFTAAVLEDFTDEPRFDLVTMVKKFYRNHEDPYDFVVVFDTVDREPDSCAFAFAIRNWVRGIGLRVRGLRSITEEFDATRVVGSSGRLQTLIYMGPLARYPADPSTLLPPGSTCGRNSVLTILGQEAGHRFLAYPRFLDPATGRNSLELLGRDFAHWSFYFNSDASLVEGNQILDRGAGMTPRFETGEIVRRFGSFDQYFMGLRGPDEVPPSFLVQQPSIDFPRGRNPQSGVFFDGTRLDITAPMIVAAEGPRLPDHTLSPKQFRFAFALLVREGTTPPAADIERLDRYRTAWETFFGQATGDRARAETRLVRHLQLSVWPAAGLLQGRTITASVGLAAPASSPVTVRLEASGGAISVPGSVTIPAGRQSAQFTIQGAAAGAAELTARGPDDSYETARAQLFSRASAAGLELERLDSIELRFGAYTRALPGALSGGLGTPLAEELIFRVRDANFLPYPGVRLTASASGAGSVAPAPLVTDERGWARVRWTLDANPGTNSLTLALDGQPEVSARAEAVGVPQPARRRDPRLPPEPVP